MEEKENIESNYDKRPTWSMIMRTLKYIKPFKWTFIVSIILVIVSTIFKVRLPVLMKEIIDEILIKGQESSSKDGYYSLLEIEGLWYFGMILMMFFCFGLATILIGRAGVYIVNNIKRDLFDHVLSLGLSWVEKVPVGSMVSRIESDSQRLTNFCSVMMLNLVQSFLTILFALCHIYFFTKGTHLFLVSILSLPFVIYIIIFMFKKLRPRYIVERKRYAELSGDASEMVVAAPLLQTLDRVDWAEQRVKKNNQRYVDYMIKIFIVQYGIFAGLNLLEALTIVIALFIGIDGVISGTMEPGTLVLFIQYAIMINVPIGELSEYLAEMQRAGGAADRIFKTFDDQTSVPDREDAITDLPVKQVLAFENVSFAYDKGCDVVHDLSLRIEPGQTVALVGKTGCGKSTLLSLLLRMRDVREGAVTYGGVNVKDFEGKAYRKLFGMVLQDLHLFPSSIEENLRVYRDDISREEVEKAVEWVGAQDLVASFDKGLDSVLEEGGKNLSYGERQLLSFARALTVGSEILLLDEATSSVDPGTELKLQKMLEKLSKDRTTLIVAHRLSTIKSADKIVVMDEGRIVEMGSHDELIARDGKYKEYVNQQESQGGR